MLPAASDGEWTAQARYESLRTDRDPFLRRARDCAALTIPAVMPPEGFTGASAVLPTPYQSLGARGVRTLASKLLLSLFPGVPFFNYKMDDEELKKLGKKRGEVEKALSARERATTTELDISVFRPAAFTALTHLVVTGNVCLLVPPGDKERTRAFRLDQYVVRRDAAGNLLEAVIVEALDINSLPEYARQAVLTKRGASRNPGAIISTKPDPVMLYTHILWDPNISRWSVNQEAEGVYLEETESIYLEDELPYLFLRLGTQPGESYGRSYVEEFLGDLDSLEALSEALVEGTAASARVVFLVRPGGTTSLKVVEKARTGAVVSGNQDDVGVLQVQKQADLNVAKAQAEEIGTRLSYAFLLHSSVQRSGERVTAEEIRFMASELDSSLGGVYTLLAADFQLPVVRLLEKRMEKRLKVPRLPKGVTRPVIVAGLEAIGRGNDQQNLAAFLKDVVTILTPEVAMQYLNPLEFMARAAASYGIDTEGLLPSEEEVQQKQQAMQLQALAQNLGPEVIKAGGSMATEAVKNSLAPPAQAPM